MLFLQDQYQYLVTSAIKQEYFVTSQFANQEFIITLPSSVYDKKCTVIGSLTAPVDQALQLLLLLHTLKQSGARSIVLFSPYLGYQRQDNIDYDASQGLQWADTMLHAAGVTQLITIEPHCKKYLQSLKVPLVSHSAELIFEEEITRFVNLGFSFIFPDAGSAMRYGWILEKFPAVQHGSFMKQRLHGMIDLQSFQGKVGRKVILYDDILDSGQTLLQVCIALRHMGVEEIVIFVTHAFFHGQAWNDLWSLGVKMLYCTDSLPNAHGVKHVNICVKSITSFLQKSI